MHLCPWGASQYTLWYDVVKVFSNTICQSLKYFRNSFQFKICNRDTWYNLVNLYILHCYILYLRNSSVNCRDAFIARAIALLNSSFMARNPIMAFNKWFNECNCFWFIPYTVSQQLTLSLTDVQLNPSLYFYPINLF